MIRRLILTSAVLGLLFGAVGGAHASQPAPASGTYTVNAITGFALHPVGANMFIEQTTEGVFSGTLTGTFEDQIKAIVHPNGLVGAQGTLTCACTVAGKSGTLEFVQVSTGSFHAQAFEGRAIITRGTGELSGLRGVLELQGTVDPNGMATVTYVGGLHDHP
jgi:hypothetical protein